LAGPLWEKGLLQLLEPETFVDQEMTEALTTAVTELATQGAFDNLDHPKYGYAELSRSRMGWDADVELSEMIIEELISRDLARPSEDGVSIPLHPAVRMTFLVLLAQLARDAGRRAGLNLHPATTRFDAVEDLIQVLSMPASPSAGHIVTLDLETVGLNLAAVPLDEILEYREQHGAAYRAYARNIRQQVAELGLLADEERRPGYSTGVRNSQTWQTIYGKQLVGSGEGPLQHWASELPERLGLRLGHSTILLAEHSPWPTQSWAWHLLGRRPLLTPTSWMPGARSEAAFLKVAGRSTHDPDRPRRSQEACGTCYARDFAHAARACSYDSCGLVRYRT